MNWFTSIKVRNPGRKKLLSRRLEVETLEGRLLMSAGPEFTLGSVGQAKFESANASSANGMSVAVWTQQFSGSDTDVKAQLYNADGTHRGAVINVGSGPSRDDQPVVAMDATGNFAVAWRVNIVSQTDIKARRFFSSGTPQAAEFFVASDGMKDEFDPSVAMDSAGNFVVTYTLQFGANDRDVRVVGFGPTGVLPTLSDRAVSQSASVNEFGSSVARTDNGRFSVAFQMGNDVIFLDQFSATGVVTSAIPISTNPGKVRNPSIAMDAAGNSVVAWQEASSGDDDILARRVSNAGSLGPVLFLRTNTTADGNPAVALSRSGNSFVVAFQTSVPLGEGISDQHVRVAEVVRGDNGTDTAHTFDLGQNRIIPAISIDGNDVYFVTYQDAGPAIPKGRFGKVGTAAPADKLAHDFQIDLRFIGTGVTTAQKAIFRQAADRWEQVILGDVPDAMFNGQLVDDLLIEIGASAIDGVNNIVGQGGPDSFRGGSFLPIHGSASFDTADLASMEASGQLFSVALHEMGHVLGIGTIWDKLGLLQGAGGDDPRFTGAQATAAFNTSSLFVTGNATSVPVANKGGAGTQDAHWREETFGDELMTGFVGAANPLSRVTVGSLADMGYSINMNAADVYHLPLVINRGGLGSGPFTPSSPSHFLRVQGDGQGHREAVGNPPDARSTFSEALPLQNLLTSFAVTNATESAQPWGPGEISRGFKGPADKSTIPFLSQTDRRHKIAPSLAALDQVFADFGWQGLDQPDRG